MSVLLSELAMLVAYWNYCWKPCPENELPGLIVDAEEAVENLAQRRDMVETVKDYDAG